MHAVNESDDDGDRSTSPHPVQVETRAEAYPEPKQEELETNKESVMTNQSGDSNGCEVKVEMQKVLESTTKEGE